MAESEAISLWSARRALARWWLLLVVILVAGCALRPGDVDPGPLRIDGVEIPEVSLRAALNDYQDVRSAAFRGWFNNGILITTRFAEHSQIHFVAEPGGMREQLTFADEAISVAWARPRPVVGAASPRDVGHDLSCDVGVACDVDGFIYAGDVGGSENYQLFWFDLAERSSTLLTDGKSRYTGLVWSRSGNLFAYSTTERDGRSWDIHVRRPGEAASVALQTDDVGWFVQDIAPDESRLLVSRYISVVESQLYELSLSGGGLRPLLDPSTPVAIGQARYSADGESVYFNSDLGGEFRRLQRLWLADGNLEVISDAIAWDIDSFAVAPDGSAVAVAINEGGLSRLSIVTLPDRRWLALPEVPVGVIAHLAFDADSERLGFSLNGPQSPSDVFSISLASRALMRWTRGEAGALPVGSLTVPELIEFDSFDELPDGAPRRIPAYIYRPDGDGPHPVVIDIHGGPESQYRPRFKHFTQFLVRELGVAVVAPNVRGSRGYGKHYLSLDDGAHREDSVRDIGALLDWVGEQPTLDASRVAVSGGSYGGYMVLASLTHYSDRLRAGVDLFGISDFVTFLEGTQAYRRDLRRREYGDERDPQMRALLREISPLSNVDRIGSPLLIYQGLNDPRVPAGESEQMVQALRAKKVPVWYIVAADEGHGMRRRSTRDYVYLAVAEFLNRYLLKAPGQEKNAP